LSTVKVFNLAKDYAGVAALADVSFVFPDSSITAIIGRSGSGKSSLLKMINGLSRPDRGRVEVFGEAVDYSALPKLRRQIGYLVQGSGLFPHLTVRENVCLLATLAGWDEPAQQQRFSQLLEMVQLEINMTARYPHELSGGQQQRVALCRAMMLNPPLLLLDEPFAALDPLTRLDVHEQLLQLQSLEPRTVILVTHDMREALKLADTILVMEHGVLVSNFSRQELRNQFPDMEPEQLLLTLLEQAA
jgi:osmoprotectant transport system ATP-binding protein